MKENFETLATTEQFERNLESAEEETLNGAMAGFINSRSSISTKFLKRTQLQNLQSIANQQSIVAQVNAL